MLKFTAVQLVDNKYVKGMISVIHQIEILQCCKLYANIECNTVPTPNPEPEPWQPQYYPPSHYSQLPYVTQDNLPLSIYVRCNTLFNKRGRETTTMLVYG